MSQTAKRHYSPDVEKQESHFIHSPPKTLVKNSLSYQVGTVGRAIRCLNEPQKSAPSKSADLDIFQNKEIFSILPFESLPHPQKLRKKSSRKVIKQRRTDFNKTFLVDNHLRQLKKRYTYTGLYETDCEQPLDECSETVDTNTLSTEDINNRYSDKFGSPLNKIPRTSSPIVGDSMFENTQLVKRAQPETFVLSDHEDNQWMGTYLDLQLRKEFMAPQYWQSLNNSIMLKEE